MSGRRRSVTTTTTTTMIIIIIIIIYSILIKFNVYLLTCRLNKTSAYYTASTGHKNKIKIVQI
jgi:hypothetical protein